MTSRLLPAAYAAVFALSLAVTLGAGLGWGGRTSERPADHSGPALTVLPTLSTQEAFFGDQVTARVEVIVDGTRVNDSSVNVRATFAPYSVAASTTARESLGGGYLRRIYTYRLHCLQAACLPRAGGQRDFRFLPVAVSVAGRTAQSAPWPHLLVVSRLHANAGLRLTGLRRPAVAPQGAGRLSPLLLWGGGGAALLGIALVAAWGVTRVRAPGRPAVAAAVAAPATDPVADACARVRAIVADGSWARRQGALDVLARRLAASGADGLASEARSLAWRRTRPSETDVAALLDRVERRESGSDEADEGVVAA